MRSYPRFALPISRRVALVCLLALPSHIALAQEPGAVAGALADSATGTPLAAVLVEMTGPDGSVVASGVTGPSGTFLIGGIPPGTYSLRFLLPGWKTASLPEQIVAPGETSRLFVEMAEGSYSLNPITVTASRTKEKILDAPAAVEVVSTEDILERPALTTVEHVRDKAGVDFMATGLLGSNLVVRGFNNVFSGATLTLTDNRIARLPSLRANISHFNPVTSLDIERTEVMLGPASALYGPNVELGVIHSVTRSPIDHPGVSLALSSGLRQQGPFSQRVVLPGADTVTLSQKATDMTVWQLEGRLAGKTGDDRFGAKISGQYFTGLDYLFIDEEEVRQQDLAVVCQSADYDVTSPACLNFAGDLGPDGPAGSAAMLRTRVDNVASGRASDLERWTIDARLDWRPTPETSVILSGGRATAVSSVDLTGLGAGQVIDWAYDYVQARFLWKDLFAQVFLNKSVNDRTYLLRSGRTLVDRSELWVGQVQHASRLGERNRLVYGFDALRTIPRTEGTINGRNEEDDEITEVGGYLQWESAPARRLDLVLAARLDKNSRLVDPVISPRAALVYHPTPEHSLRLTFNRAFSTPNTISLFLDISAQSIPITGPFFYDARAQGGSDVGFTFRREDGVPMHQSPFNPLLGGGPQEFLPTTTGQLWNEAVALVGADDPALGDLLAALPPPDGSEVGVIAATPDLEQGNFVSLPGALEGVRDLPPLDPGITNTLEAGYKGLLEDRLLLSASLWYSRITDKISDLRVISPNVFLEGASLGSYLTDHFLGLVGTVFPDEETARAAATELAATMGEIPLGVLAPEQAGGTFAALVLTDRNLPAASLFGADLSLSLLLGSRWSLEATAAWLSDDVLTAGEGSGAGVIRLNAPALKGSATLRYRDTDSGLNGALRFRATKGFPASSGVYAGAVEGYQVVDLNAGYRFRRTGLWLQLEVQNLFDTGYSTFPGAPMLGRLTMLRLRYDLAGL
jgi:iron complex outermembrane receptor protein